MITSTMKLRLSIVFFLLYIIVQTAFSQLDERFFSKYNYHYITESEGVPHSFVDDILCDSEGFIWMATHNGIGRYDGYQVMSINTQTQPLKLKNDFCMYFVRIIFVGCGSDLREDLKPLI